MIPWIQRIRWQKIFVMTVKGLDPATSCVRHQDATTTPVRHILEPVILKLSPIHTSVIYQIPWIRWTQWSSASFRKNSNVFHWNLDAWRSTWCSLWLCHNAEDWFRLLLSLITVPYQGRMINHYRSGMVNSNTVNSKFHLIRSFFEIFARFLSFHV